MSPPTDDEETITSALVKHFPQYLAVGAALAYATGFLVVLTFLDRFGIHESGGDLFKIKYIHVGILALFLPVACAIPSVLTLSMISSTKRSLSDSRKASADDCRRNDRNDASVSQKQSSYAKNLKVGAANFLLMANMLLCLTIFVLFAPPHFFVQREWVLPAVFAATFAGLLLIWWFSKIEWNPEHENTLVRRLSEWAEAGAIDTFLKFLLLPALVVLAASTAWRGLTKDVWVILWGEKGLAPKGAIFYILLVCLWIYALARTRWFASGLRPGRAKSELYVAGLIVAGGLYFLSVLAFSFRVYPFIPHERGGGDYTSSPLVALYLSGSASGFPERLRDKTIAETKSIPVIVIDQSTTSFYVADPADEGGPFEWRKSDRFPHVVEIPTANVRSVEYRVPHSDLIAQVRSRPGRVTLPDGFVDHMDGNVQVSKKLSVVKQASKFIRLRVLTSTTTLAESKARHKSISISRADLERIDLFHPIP